MNLRDSFLIVVGWVGLCLVSGSMVTVVAQVLPS